MNAKTSKQALIIFVKNAELGKVKTRLAKTVGDQQALKIYKVLLHHTKEIALTSSATRFLFYSQFVENDHWSPQDFQKFVQQGADLGERMQHAFELAFQQHQKVIIIGSDCASLSPEILQQAFDQLDHFPFVIGPALDGGYYLLGMRQYSPNLFENIAWSTDQVLQTTLQKINELQQSCFLLPELSDIDNEEDWKQYGWKIE